MLFRKKCNAKNVIDAIENVEEEIWNSGISYDSKIEYTSDRSYSTEKIVKKLEKQAYEDAYYDLESLKGVFDGGKKYNKLINFAMNCLEDEEKFP